MSVYDHLSGYLHEAIIFKTILLFKTTIKASNNMCVVYYIIILGNLVS